jgi:ferric-dicitrate binding protein FerR (iron transport regulator)
MQVKVLGTHFNISSYESDTIWKTTLVEGKVEVLNGGENAVLAPGNQAQIRGRSSLSVIQKVNTEEVIAWKNGYLQFTNVEIETVMSQISRWYDVEIVYKGVTTGEHFTGTISKTMPTADLLHLLDVSGIHCKIESRKMIVLP